MTSAPSLREAIAEPMVGRRPLRAIVAAYLVSLAAVVVFVGVDNAKAWWFWVGTGLAVLLYCTAFAATLLPDPGRFDRRSAVVAVGLLVAAQAATWLTVAVDQPVDVSFYEPLIASAYVGYVMIVFRNYLAIAWTGAAIGVVLGFVLGSPRLADSGGARCRPRASSSSRS